MTEDGITAQVCAMHGTITDTIKREAETQEESDTLYRAYVTASLNVLTLQNICKPNGKVDYTRAFKTTERILGILADERTKSND
jgi:hypothetical protein